MNGMIQLQFQRPVPQLRLVVPAPERGQAVCASFGRDSERHLCSCGFGANNRLLHVHIRVGRKLRPVQRTQLTA